MRKIAVILALCLTVSSLTGCAQIARLGESVMKEFSVVAESAAAEAASAASGAVEAVGQEITGLTEIISVVESIGSLSEELGKEMEGFGELSETEKYQLIGEVKNSFAELEKLLDTILELCEGKPVLDNLAYQVKLLKNLEPDLSELDSAGLEKLTSLYPLYLAQISSSMEILGRDIESLREGKGLTDGVQYFTYVPGLPKPETVISSFAFLSEGEEQGMQTVKYDLGTDAEAAETAYTLYLLAAQMDTGLAVSIGDGAAFISRDGKTVAIVGMDSKSGSSICTFYFKK